MFVVPALIATAFGWIGALCSVSAYAAVTAKRITADSVTFQSLNLAGAALLCVSAYSHGAWPSAIVNIIWIGIGVFALRAIWQARRTIVNGVPVTPADIIAAELISAEAAPELAEGPEPVEHGAPSERHEVAAPAEYTEAVALAA